MDFVFPWRFGERSSGGRSLKKGGGHVRKSQKSIVVHRNFFILHRNLIYSLISYFSIVGAVFQDGRLLDEPRQRWFSWCNKYCIAQWGDGNNGGRCVTHVGSRKNPCCTSVHLLFLGDDRRR